jgi:hypothetical protein
MAGSNSQRRPSVSDAGPDLIDGLIVVTWVALVRLQPFDGPVFDPESGEGCWVRHCHALALRAVLGHISSMIIARQNIRKVLLIQLVNHCPGMIMTTRSASSKCCSRSGACTVRPSNRQRAFGQVDISDSPLSKSRGRVPDQPGAIHFQDEPISGGHVLVQREMESSRFPLASIQRFSDGSVWRRVADVVTARGPRQVAEAATGFRWHGTKSIVWCLEEWCFKPLRPDCSLDLF